MREKCQKFGNCKSIHSIWDKRYINCTVSWILYLKCYLDFPIASSILNWTGDLRFIDPPEYKTITLFRIVMFWGMEIVVIWCISVLYGYYNLPPSPQLKLRWIDNVYECEFVLTVWNIENPPSMGKPELQNATFISLLLFFFR